MTKLMEFIRHDAHSHYYGEIIQTLGVGNSNTKTILWHLGNGTTSENITLAHLIVAVPDLLEACKDTRFVINSDPTLHHLRSEPWWKKLQTAIAKAEGK